jgi:hypothetical protein
MAARRSPFLKALAALRDALRECKAPAAVIGGVAIIARGVARHTADIDATVLAAAVENRRLLACFTGHGFVARIPKPLEFARENQILLLRHGPTGVDLDLSLAWLPFEADAIANAEPIDYAGVTLPCARAEDLLIYKLIAHRNRDLDDVERLLLLHRKAIDMARVRRVLGQLAEALEGPDRLQTLARLSAASLKGRSGSARADTSTGRSRGERSR